MRRPADDNRVADDITRPHCGEVSTHVRGPNKVRFGLTLVEVLTFESQPCNDAQNLILWVLGWTMVKHMLFNEEFRQVYQIHACSLPLDALRLAVQEGPGGYGGTWLLLCQPPLGMDWLISLSNWHTI